MTAIRGILFAAAMMLADQASAATVVEFYNPDLDNYFITADPAEQSFVDSGAVGRWQRTGDTFAAGGPNLVCRFYGNSNINPATGTIYGPNSHFYTAGVSECENLKAIFNPNAKSWKFESNDFATTAAINGTCSNGLVPVYRAYNNGYARGVDSNHRITSNYTHYQQMVMAGWAGEGVVMCAPSAAGPLPASSAVAGQCAAPRPAGLIDPDTGLPYGDVQGSLDTEKAWIRSYVNETYLWYQDVPAIDPAPYMIGATVPYVVPSNNARQTITLRSNYGVADAYFNSQRSPLFTASGKPKDQFHFTYLTSEWQALASSGNSAGFGFEVALLAASPPRMALVAYTSPATPAAQNLLGRGTQFLSVNGVDLINGADVATLNEGLFAPVPGKQYTFQVLDQGSATPRVVTMTAVQITLRPVQNAGTLPAPYSSVGYMQFNDHIATAEIQLIAAVNQLKVANNGFGVSDLVLDMRYNGGGYLDIASELAYMIAGPEATNGKIFEKESFNDKNPFGLTDAQTSMPFHNVTQGFSAVPGQSLPQLGLSRVFVITSSNTCSASEAVINGLRGIGIDVIQIGGTTCGKPYGFFPQDNCGATYFTVQFKGVNHAGFGDYADGFIPAGTGAAANNLPGCAVADDFTKPLGNPGEARLAAALQYRASGTCPAASDASVKSMPRMTGLAQDPLLIRSPLRENRLFRAQLPRY